MQAAALQEEDAYEQAILEELQEGSQQQLPLLDEAQQTRQVCPAPGRNIKCFWHDAWPLPYQLPGALGSIRYGACCIGDLGVLSCGHQDKTRQDKTRDYICSSQPG